mmetsp:Transcript_15402/g.32640  ORF Transcript_15402/g.32640 Transcript_15402/m.32640 type:complete len:217 (-) Transcript_15402:144-794(-)
MRQHCNPCFVRIIRIRGYEICTSQSKCTTDFSFTLQHNPRPILVLASLIHQNLRPVPQPPMTAIRHEIPRLHDQYLGTLRPRNFRIGRNLLHVVVFDDQFVVKGYGLLSGEEGTDAIEGGVDGGVDFETGVGRVFFGGGGDGIDVFFVAGVWHPLDINLRPTILIKLLLDELIANHRFPSIGGPIQLFVQDLGCPFLHVLCDAFEFSAFLSFLARG